MRSVERASWWRVAISASVVSAPGEVGECGSRVWQKGHRDPARGEMLLAAIVLVPRCGGAVGDLVSELELLEVEQLAGNHPPLHPPLVGIDQPLRLARRRQQ